MMIIVIASLAMLVERLDASQARLRRTRDAAAALSLAKTALIGYAVSYRDLHPEENFGYLPCPDGTGSGIEQTPCGKGGSMAVGLLPYKTLGLPDLRDAGGNRLWYAVSGSFKSNPKSSPFNWDTQGQLTVRDDAGRLLAAEGDAGGGAAAVIVAPGPPLAKQQRNAAAGAEITVPTAYLENNDTNFVDIPVAAGGNKAAANDRVAWIAPKEIFDKIVGRSDFADFMSEGIDAVQSKLGKQNATAGNVLPGTNPFGKQTSNYNFYDGWKDQFRYLRCTGCYSDQAGNNYKAVLLFSGRSASGSPRAPGSRALSDYFESALSLAQGQKTETCSAAIPTFDNSSAATRAVDMALCLVP